MCTWCPLTLDPAQHKLLIRASPEATNSIQHDKEDHQCWNHYQQSNGNASVSVNQGWDA